MKRRKETHANAIRLGFEGGFTRLDHYIGLSKII